MVAWRPMVGVEDYSCGSGGGIYVSVTTLQGSGHITAAGGSGGYGGGGGGRVAVYAADYSQFDLASIRGVGWHGVAFEWTAGRRGHGLPA